MTFDDAREFLRIGKFTLYRLAMAGEISYMRQGKQMLFITDSMELWLQRTYAGPSQGL